MPPNLAVGGWAVFITYDPNVVTFLNDQCLLGPGTIGCALDDGSLGNISIGGIGDLTNASATLATLKFSAIGAVDLVTNLSFAVGTNLRTIDGDNVSWVQGASAKITISSAPTITSFTPSGAWAGGGTTITITGTNFVAGATVQFGTRYATSATVLNSTTITAKAPPVSIFGDVTGDGAVNLVDAICVLRKAVRLSSVDNCPVVKMTTVTDVSVTNPGGQSAKSANSFIYQNADVTNDSKIELLDAICVLRKASRLPSVANCPTPVTYADP